MRKPKWHAKALYIIFALALVIGLTPLTALAGHADIVISGPCYAKEGETITFEALTDPEADSVDWSIDGTPAGTDSSAPFELVTTFPAGSEGRHVVSAVGNWGANLDQEADFEILVGVGLIPQLEYNIIGTEATFRVPTVYQGHVKCWRYQPSTDLGAWNPMGGGIVSGGMPLCPTAGSPGDDSVTVDASTWGELVIYTQTYDFTDPGTGAFYPATELMAIKKWGKIWDTWLFGWDCYTEEMIYDSGETQVWWNENDKKWEGEAQLYDLIIGNFITDGGEEHVALAHGADVEWWVMDSRAPVHDLPSDVPASVLVPLIEEMQEAYPSRLIGFGDCTTKYVETVSGDTAGPHGEDVDGLTGVTLVACGEEAVKIVVVAKYPDRLHYPQWGVFPEIISWNFWTQELEKVPQVRWAGEKVVLEKQFGTSYTGNPVLFNLENQSCGSLFPVDEIGILDAGRGLMPGGAMGAQQVLTYVDELGVARAIVESEDQCECDVTVSLYDMAFSSNMDDGSLINQHGFVVFFLKLEDLTLGNVEGEREGHDAGQFTPENPWADTEEDPLTGLVEPVDPVTGELNVSQDALLRARVRGWFMGDNLSNRPARVIDTNHNGVEDIHDEVLPAGRWVLPDDWPYLAGHDPLSSDTEWMEMRPHWDIMTQPNDNVMSIPDGQVEFDGDQCYLDEMIDKLEELGDYVWWDSTGALDVPGDLVAEAPVIGPYSTLDNYAPEVYYKTLPDGTVVPVVLAGIDYDGDGDPTNDGRKTIVPNSKLNWWDCPMSPAKIIFEITEGAGFFKDADKGDIYYEWVDTDYDPCQDSKVYTNPFYEMMIPSSPFIPPFVNNGGYDWDSWDPAYGPYPFWDIINQPEGMTPSDAQHPTKVHVYSDNHGEAMVWLNGDWNLDLSAWLTNGAYDVPTGEIVGDSTVVAKADYPYLRKHPWLISNEVEKTWTWGKDVRGNEPARYPGGSMDPPDTRMVFQVGDVVSCTDPELTHKKLAFIWVCDRDGFPAIGERVEWSLGTVDGSQMAIIPPGGSPDLGVSICLPEIYVVDGFLAGTGGHTTNPDRTMGESFLREPTAAELELWDKFWPGEPCHHAVAAVEVYTDEFATRASLSAFIYEREGTIIRQWNLDFSVVDNPDDPLTLGDANMDSFVDAGDITKVKRIYFGVDSATIGADANQDTLVDTGDITQVKKIYFGA